MRVYDNGNAAEELHESVIADVYAYPQAPSYLKESDWKKALYVFLKRVMDIVLSALALIVLSPLFLAVAVAIKLDSKGPVFFAHERVGLNGSALKLYKFRSMAVNAKELFEQFSPEQKRLFYENYKLDDDPRITRVGSVLRKTSLDELPQLLNIIRGNLSIIGPRPIVAQELEKYGIMDRRFLSVKPGLSGYWQVNGRSCNTYEERMALELYYVEHASFWLDVCILFKSFWAVLACIGAK